MPILRTSLQVLPLVLQRCRRMIEDLSVDAEYIVEEKPEGIGSLCWHSGFEAL